MEKKIGNFQIFIEKDYEALSKRAANIFAEKLKDKPNGVFGFATGASPVGLYRELISKYNAKEIDFSNITSFNLDEYYPISSSSDKSYRYFMETNLFNHVNINKNKINIPNGEVKDIDSEVSKYDDSITNSGGIDMQILGIGINGHIGFNEPDNHFPKKVHCVALTESTIEANAIYFESKDKMPKHAFTMGIGNIMSTSSILMLISGSKKAAAVSKMINGEITPQVPASILQLHKNVIVVLDEEASKELH